MNRFAAAAAAILLCFTLAACDDVQPTADQQDQQKQETMQQSANQQIGMPGITNYTEKKLIKRLYELRDQQLPTHAYVMSLDGKLFHVCESLGYGIPYATQYSNPEKHELGTAASNSYEIPQAEPNMLYMPATAEGTWVLCADPKAQEGFKPIYIEPQVIVSPYKLNAAGEWFAQQ